MKCHHQLEIARLCYFPMLADHFLCPSSFSVGINAGQQLHLAMCFNHLRNASEIVWIGDMASEGPVVDPDRARGRPRNRRETQPGVEQDQRESFHSPGEAKCAGGFAPVGHLQREDGLSQLKMRRNPLVVSRVNSAHQGLPFPCDSISHLVTLALLLLKHSQETSSYKPSCTLAAPP